LWRRGGACILPAKCGGYRWVLGALEKEIGWPVIGEVPTGTFRRAPRHILLAVMT
jgi:hypothetical protein